VNIADKLKELLEEKSVTPYRVAKEIGVSQTTIKNWVTGYTAPKERHIKALADYFGITTDELLGKEKQPTTLGELHPANKKLMELSRTLSPEEAEKVYKAISLLLGK
jgi:transcriptional regulator with XRE-family HTH domain